MSLTSRTSMLVFLAQLRPEMFDAIIPNNPVISIGARHIMASMLIKSIAQELKDTGLSEELHRAGKILFDAGMKSISYNENIWFWGPQPDPWQQIFGKADTMLNPQPLPPHEQAYYGAHLILIANTISFDNIQDVVHTIGMSLMKTSAEKTYRKDPAEMPLFNNV